MKEIDWIIDEQATLLKRKGYTESWLNNPDIEGSFKLHLKDAVQNILDEGAIYPISQPVQVHLFGYFGKDQVSFTFNYDFDVSDRELTLKGVDARLNTMELPVTIDNGRDLWKSEELYDRLKQLVLVIQPILSQEQNAKQKAIQESVFKEQANMIASKGYSTADLWLKKFTEKLGAQSPEHDKITSFRQIIRTHTVPPFEARFHFNYLPAVTALKLTSIYFKYEDVSRMVLHPGPHQIPLPQVMAEWLKTDKAIATAKNIANVNHATPSSRLKK